MKKRPLMVIALSCAIVVSAASAADTPPTEASIKELLKAGRVHEMVDSMAGQMDSYMKQAMQQATQGQHVTPEIQKRIDRFEAEMTAAAKETLDWNSLEPIYIRDLSQVADPAGR